MVLETTVLDLAGNSLIDVQTLREKYINGPYGGLKYGWKSNVSNTEDQGHWNRSILVNSRSFPCDLYLTSFIDKHPELKRLFEVVQEVIGDRCLLRAYINGYTYGTDGYPHKDDIWIRQQFGQDCLSETVIIYLNDKWDFSYAGETVIFDNNKEIETSLLPKLGRMLIFDSEKWHAARPVSRICKELRLILAIKTIDKKFISKEISYILEKTNGVVHSGRPFFEHLFNTMLIVENNTKDSIVTKAALYHSIYGTEYYKAEEQFNIPSRESIKDLIGIKSEELVYQFCNMKNRAHTLLTNENNYNPYTLKSLIEIEIANLLEQNYIREDYTQQIMHLKQKAKSIEI